MTMLQTIRTLREMPQYAADRERIYAAVEEALAGWERSLGTSTAYHAEAREWCYRRVICRRVAGYHGPMLLYTPEQWERFAAEAAQECPKFPQWQREGFRISPQVDPVDPFEEDDN
jgi:hypothetical protein